MKIKGGFTGKRSVQGKNLIGQYTMWWLNSWMITIGSSWIVNDQSKSCPSANEMQRIAMARQALLVQQCKEAQIEAGPGVRVKCEVSSSIIKNMDAWTFAHKRFSSVTFHSSINPYQGRRYSTKAGSGNQLQIHASRPIYIK